MSGEPEGISDTIRSILGLTRLSSVLCCRFEDLGHHPDIINSTRCLQLALHITPGIQIIRSNLLSLLGLSYNAHFNRLGHISHLNRTVDCHSQAMLLIPVGHANRLDKLSWLAKSCLQRFDCLERSDDLDKAIECLEQAKHLTPHGHPGNPSMLDSLGIAYQFLFKRHAEISYLDKAISCHQEALLLAPNDHAAKIDRLANLGNSYYYRFRRIGELEDINRAIEYHSQATLLTPENDAKKSALLSNLGEACISRYDSLGKIEDLHKGIACQSQAVHLTSNDHAYKPGLLKNLGTAYDYRFQRLGELSDIEKMISCRSQAVLLTPHGHAHKPGLLGALGASYLHRFNYLGELADLNQALDYLIQVTLTPEGHASPTTLNDLGQAYESRFERLGNITDIDKAISYRIQAVELTPEDHPYRPSRLNNLGTSYLRRHERRGELEDVDNAIHWQTKAVELTPEGHSDKPNRLMNLGSSHLVRYDFLGRTEDIKKAVEFQYQAVLLTPDGHASLPGRLTSLGDAYRGRSERLREVSDIGKAIECHRRAVLLIPDGHAARPVYPNNLGNGYLYRFNYHGELADLNKAIEYYNQAVQLSPDGHAEKAMLFTNLGVSYLRRFKRQGELLDVEGASTSFQHAAQSAITNPSMQLRSARKWAESSSLLGRSPHQAYQRTMELVPQLVWLGSTINQRYFLTTQLNDAVTEAAAWAVSVQAYELAIEWLEMGRSIVWNQIMHLRTPFDDLSAADPSLAQHLQDVGKKQNQYRHHLATEWDRLLSQARQLPGFRNFMTPRQFGVFADVATQGAVIVINVHQSQCDALILRPNNAGIAHVPLRDFTSDKALGAHEQFSALIGRLGTRSRGFRPAIYQPELRKVLAMLWTDVAKPILDFLGYTQKLPIDELPRVTWCTAGALSFLPLHAAGYYDGSHANVPDLVISSYTPTLSALTSAISSSSIPAFGLLAVGQEHNKGFDTLPGTIDELRAIKEQAHATHYTQLDGHLATVEAVLDSMDKHSWVHLACHATQNSDDPAESAFHLHEGSLTLKAITKRSFHNKGLAFLSACQTAAGSDLFPDEATHLAAGMLMAGYPSVIATMWSIYDVDGPEVAMQVYAELLKDGKMDHTGAARALHKAVAGLRGKIGPDSFKRWVPFIHTGV